MRRPIRKSAAAVLAVAMCAAIFGMAAPASADRRTVHTVHAG